MSLQLHFLLGVLQLFGLESDLIFLSCKTYYSHYNIIQIHPLYIFSELLGFSWILL